MIFKIVRKCWWESFPGVEIGIVKAYSAGKRAELLLYAIHEKDYSITWGFFLLPSPMFLSFLNNWAPPMVLILPNQKLA